MPDIFCRKCQGLVEEGQSFCPRCYTPVKQASLLRRIFDRFVEWCGGFTGAADGGARIRFSPFSSTNIIVRKSEQVTLHDEATGEVREFSSIDDLPPNVRAMIEAAMKPGSALMPGDRFGDVEIEQLRRTGKVTEQSIMKRITTGPDGAPRQEITVRDNDGVERRYASVDELPPEMRRLLDEFRSS